MKRLTVALIAALSSPLVLAFEKPYVGIDYQLGTYSESNFEVNPEALRLRGGTEINPYFAVEAQAGIGSQSDVATVGGGIRSDIKIESFYALFARPQIKVSDFATVYGLLGSSYVDVSKSATALQPAYKDFGKSFSYGVGADFQVYKAIRLGADYIHYINGYTAVSFGMRMPIE